MINIKPRLIFRYLFIQLICQFIMFTIIFTVLAWITQLTKILDIIAASSLNIQDFLKIAVLLLPSLSLITIPFSLVLSVLTVFIKLDADNELIILRALGYSNRDISVPAIFIAILITIFSYYNIFVLAPNSHYYYYQFKKELQNNYINFFVQDGGFNFQFQDVTVYIDKKHTDVMQGIFIYDSRSVNQISTITAQQGTMQANNDGITLLLKHGTNFVYDKRSNNRSLLNFQEYYFHINLDNARDINKKISYDDMTFSELYNIIVTEQSIQSDRYLKALSIIHRRITWPLCGLSGVLISLFLIIRFDQEKRSFSIKRYILAFILSCLLMLATQLVNNINFSNKQFFYIPYFLNLVVIIATLYKIIRV